MKVFISWSGPLSKGIAEIVKPWIKCVLQATEPFISTEDIQKGSLWFNEISNQLANTAVGIICLTPENISAPWILFEAGALAKGLSSSRVCPLLINLKPSDLDDPLARFNLTTPSEQDMFKLVSTINSAMENRALPQDILKMTFDSFWADFSVKMDIAMHEHESVNPSPKSDREILEEILEISRAIQRTQPPTLEQSYKAALQAGRSIANATGQPVNDSLIRAFVANAFDLSKPIIDPQQPPTG